MRVDEIADESKYSATIHALRAIRDLETKSLRAGESPAAQSAAAVRISVDDWRSSQAVVVSSLATSFEVEEWLVVDGASVARPSIVPARSAARSFVASVARLGDAWVLDHMPNDVVRLLAPGDVDVLRFTKDLKANEARRKGRYPFIAGYVADFDSWEESEAVLGFVVAGLTTPWHWGFTTLDQTAWGDEMLTRLNGHNEAIPDFTSEWCDEFLEHGVARLAELEGGQPK